jgi:hypothetical protein
LAAISALGLIIGVIWKGTKLLFWQAYFVLALEACGDEHMLMIAVERARMEKEMETQYTSS